MHPMPPIGILLTYTALKKHPCCCDAPAGRRRLLSLKMSIYRHDPAAVSGAHALSQGPSISALLRVGASTPFKGKATEQAIAAISTPGELISVELPPVPRSVLDGYACWTGGSPGALVPAHLFPQWTFPPMIEALRTLPFAMTAILNQGCRLEIYAPLPAGEPMQCTAQLVELQREPGKIKITTKITTSTESGGLACVALVYAVIPQKAPRAEKKSSGAALNARREPARVPAEADCVATHTLGRDSGRHYACLSGDFNPIHWVPPAARAAGFPYCILHGFAQMALVQEDLVRNSAYAYTLLDVQPPGAGPVRVLDVRFVSPLVLPGTMSVHVTLGDTTDSDSDSECTVHVADEHGAVTLIGTFELASEKEVASLPPSSSSLPFADERERSRL